MKPERMPMIEILDFEILTIRCICIFENQIQILLKSGTLNIRIFKR